MSCSYLYYMRFKYIIHMLNSIKQVFQKLDKQIGFTPTHKNALLTHSEK